MSELVFSVSPHVKSNNSTRKVMLSVIISLLPVSIVGIVYFGVTALMTILTAVISALLSEIVYELICGKKFKDIMSALDYSSAVTGLIIALILPANWHLYVPCLSSIFAVIVVKMLFGGTGMNLVNPAAAGRIFAFISFTTIMNAFPTPNVPAIHVITGASAMTGATSLQSFLNGGATLSLIDLLLGSGIAGCIGETCKIAILIGWIFLSIRKIIVPFLPAIAIATAGLVAVMLNGFEFSAFLPTILSGGLMFGAVFMATDYVTNALTLKGNILFFILFGALTAVLRHFTGYETASFAILLCNILVPIINKITLSKPFGYKKHKGAK